MFQYVEGDATQPVGTRPAVVAHVVNYGGAWGAGFVLAISARWPKAERAYRAWHQGYAALGETLPLGRVQYVRVSPAGERPIWVANMVAQRTPGEVYPPIVYPALSDTLRKVTDKAVAFGADVHMPRIGAGLAGGDWAVIEAMIAEEADRVSFAGVKVYVYIR